MYNFIRKNLIFVILSLYFVLALILLFYVEGTGERGSGDSILHYLYAKYAINDIKLFFNHWAKPIYVLLAFPFAQFGIKGLMFFNIVLSLFTVYFTYKTAISLQLKNAIVSAIILICTPLYFTLLFSGLTEPLFAFVLISSTYLFIKERWIFGALLLSFLPFVRSEGLIFIGVFAFYLMLKKHWKYIPLLGVGHVFYAITGYFIYHDFLWIFNRIPYAKLSSTYGSGRLIHFVDQLYYVVGLPLYLLLCLGIFVIVFNTIKKKTNLFSEMFVLIFGGFLIYFVAHSLFWYLGIFNSMGLKRVLIAVAPFIAIISIMGLNTITEIQWIKNSIIKTIILWIFIIAIVLFPVSGNKAGINWNEDFSLTKEQHLAKEIADYIAVNQTKKSYFYYNPYLSEVLNINHFDVDLRKELRFSAIDSASTGDIIIWDSWFSFIENGISEETIVSQPTLEVVKSFKFKEEDNEIGFVILRKK